MEAHLLVICAPIDPRQFIRFFDCVAVVIDCDEAFSDVCDFFVPLSRLNFVWQAFQPEHLAQMEWTKAYTLGEGAHDNRDGSSERTSIEGCFFN
jgi:hypothetical protein